MCVWPTSVFRAVERTLTNDKCSVNIITGRHSFVLIERVGTSSMVLNTFGSSFVCMCNKNARDLRQQNVCIIKHRCDNKSSQTDGETDR